MVGEQTPSLAGLDQDRLALVLSGGGNLGVVQAPFLEHLIAIGVTPDLIVGTSVGALNGAFLAFHPQNIDGLGDIWRALRDQRLWHRNILRIGQHLLGRRMSLYSSQFLHELIAPYVTVDEISASEIPLFITATSLSQGRKHVFTRGPVVNAILASSAVPGLFPPVQIGGEWFVDAGVATGLDLETAILQGATDILAVDLGSEPSPYRPRGLVDLLARSMEIATQERTRSEVDQFGRDARTVVWRPGLQASSGSNFADVDRLYDAASELAPALIEQSRTSDGSWKPGIYEGAVAVRHA